MRATINDIARKAGVSKTTVSFAFNNPSKISRETCARIMEIAREIGYVPDPVARTLAMKQTGVIGLLLPQSIQEVFHNPYISEIMRGIGFVCDREGLSLSILSPRKGVLSHTIRNAAVDGIITLGIGPGMRVLDLFAQRRLPFVTIDGGVAPGNAPGTAPGAAAEGAAAEGALVNIGIDDEKAGFDLMDAVLVRGHRDIAIFTLKNVSLPDNGDNFSMTNDHRLAGFSRALMQRGLAPVSSDEQPAAGCGARVFHTEATLESGSLTVRDIFDSDWRPTAVVCLADIQAMGVYEECRARNLSIPGDLSVIGFDDIPSASFLSPPLTTLRQPGFTKGETAAETLLAIIAKKPAASARMESEVIIRGSLASISPA